MATSGELQVKVEGTGRLAQWTCWQSAMRKRRLSAFGSRGKRPTLFVGGEVMVHESERTLINELTTTFGAQIIARVPLPAAPRGIEGVRRIEPDAMPTPVRLWLPSTLSIADATSRIQRVIELKGGLEGEVVFSSREAASLTALVAERAGEGHRIGLNLVGRSESLPLAAPIEWPHHPAGPNPFQWQCFAGKSQIAKAWQLVESYRLLRGLLDTNAVYIGILDAGFCLDGAGNPLIPPGQGSSDFGLGVLQQNMMNPSPAGGTNSSTCGSRSILPGFEVYCPWRGNGVASAAGAAVGNGIGAAGSGGTVGRVALFKTDNSLDQIYHCLNTCAAWGIPVLNMSISILSWEPIFSFNDWNDSFQFAADHGVIVVAAAGNDAQELPNYNVRPATRTPGVITVGALDSTDQAAGYSNFGSSVDIWAPGDSIPVAPDDDNPQGSVDSGTSVASPIVAGVVAMLRYIDPSVDSGRAKQILTSSAWRGPGRVTAGLDALAAISSLLGNLLPDTAEPNDTSGQAVQLTAIGPGGSLAPTFDGITARSSKGDEDWWWFRADSFSNVSIMCEWYSPLAALNLDFIPDDPESAVDLSQPTSPGLSTLSGVLPPGVYRIRITGAGLTAYRLLVTLSPFALTPDQFERNDSFDQAPRLLFESPTPPILQLFTWYPGKYDATLHIDPRIMFSPGKSAINPDFFRLEVPSIKGLSIPTVTISDTDFPVDVELFDSARASIMSWPAVRRVDVQPPPSTTCYLKVSGSHQTRYTIRFGMRVDKNRLPGPLKADPFHLPKWWGNPPVIHLGDVEHYVVSIDAETTGQDSIQFQPVGGKLKLAIVGMDGAVNREGDNEVSIAGLGQGMYLLRLSQQEPVNKRVSVYQLPPKQ